jgi:sugar-specific transcriptional regulator TrmB
MKGRAAQIVAVLVAGGPMEVTTIAVKTGIPRSSVNRVCLELVESGELSRRSSSPIVYVVNPGVSAPKWIAGDTMEAEPMVRQLFEAAREELRSTNQPKIIAENPHYIAAQKRWGST